MANYMTDTSLSISHLILTRFIFDIYCKFYHRITSNYLDNLVC